MPVLHLPTLRESAYNTPAETPNSKSLRRLRKLRTTARITEKSHRHFWHGNQGEAKYLALTKAHYDNIRANITYSRLDSRGRGRVQLAAELPLLYTAGRWPTPPEVNYPAPADENVEKPRRVRESEIEAEPFLVSIPAYRYRRGH
jgi:hypothetical protein